MKRSFDFSAALVALILLSPLILILMACVKLTSPGPAVFRQERVGMNGKIFRICKLRSMTHREVLGSAVTTAGDVRVTGFGRFLRRFKLDELPQLWNVLKGEMSFVGPRPDVPGYADRLTGDTARLLELRPGATGPATLCFRDEEELLAQVRDPQVYNDQVLYPAKVRVNLEYMDRWSFGKDIGFLLVTALPSLDRWLHLVPSRNKVLPAEGALK